MRRRSHLTAAEWAERLDSFMRRVLAAPERYDPSTVYWARWRRRWLASRQPADGEGGLNLWGDSAQTAARAKFSQPRNWRMPRLLAAAPGDPGEPAP
jgi:hypothetical protein